MSRRKQFLSHFRKRLGEAFQTGSSELRKLAQLSAELPEGSLLADYRIIRKIGQGGMGAVYEAEHIKLRNRVAIKKLHSHLSESAEVQGRFRREVHASGAISNPHIVQAYDARVVDGEVILILELLRGGDLRQILKWKKTLSIGAACEIARQVALGLDHLDRHGVVHRDIKPSNLFLNLEWNAEENIERFEVKLLDLGLARLRPTAADQSLTGDGQIIGTEDYIAPEQIRGGEVDIRADLYSLGCSLFYLIAGRSPFHHVKGTYLKLHAHLYEAPPRLGAFVNDVPEALEHFVDMLLSKVPNERCASPREVAERLAAFSDRQELCELADEFSNFRGLHEHQVDGECSTIGEMPPASSPIGVKQKTPRRWMGQRWGTGLILLAIVSVATFFGNDLLLRPAREGDSRLMYPAIPTRVARSEQEVIHPGLPDPPVRTEQQSRYLFFDGVDDCIKTPFVLEDEYHFTMEMWFTPYGTLDQRKKELISNAEAAGISIGMKYDSELGFYLHNGATYMGAALEDSVRLGKRMHIAAVYDGISLAFYVDGKPHGTKTPFRKRHRASPLPLHLGANPDPKLVGRDVETLRDCFRGIIHEFRLTSGVRYSDTFQPTTRLVSDDSTVIHYRMDKSDGDLVADLSGNEMHGSIVGATWLDEAGLKKFDAIPRFEWRTDQPVPAIAPLTSDEARRVQAEWAEALAMPVEREFPIPGAEPLIVRLIPPGEFEMGSSQADLSKYLAAGDGELSEEDKLRFAYESPSHKVMITQPFYMAVEKVTYRQVQAVFEQRGRKWDAWDEYVDAMNMSEQELEVELSKPATLMTWYDVSFFWITLNELQKEFFVTTPTEAQWEYACRAGTTSDWSTTDDRQQTLVSLSPKEAFEPHLELLSGTVNAWGIRNMHVTPAEWCADAFRRGAYGTRTRIDPFVRPVDHFKNVRGGDPLGRPVFSRSADRHFGPSRYPTRTTGFRVILRLPDRDTAPDPQSDSP